MSKWKLNIIQVTKGILKVQLSQQSAGSQARGGLAKTKYKIEKQDMMIFN